MVTEIGHGLTQMVHSTLVGSFFQTVSGSILMPTTNIMQALVLCLMEIRSITLIVIAACFMAVGLALPIIVGYGLIQMVHSTLVGNICLTVSGSTLMKVQNILF